MKTILLFILFSLGTVVYAQLDQRFVNYAPKAKTEEGDDNYSQVINIQIPSSYTGPVFIRLFDMSVGSSIDMPIGVYDSRFRFSLYKEEHTEDNFRTIAGYRADVKELIVNHFEIGEDKRFFDKWYSFKNVQQYLDQTKIFSLLVEGVDGNDANVFNLFVSSDSLENNAIEGVTIFSYEPTIALRKFDPKQSFKVMPAKGENEITLNTFDLDRTQVYFSSLLKDEIPVIISSSGWSSFKFTLHDVEDSNYCSLDISSEDKPYNDITFRFTSKENTKLPILLPSFKKEESSIPIAVKEIKSIDCNTVQIDFSGSYSKLNNPLEYHWFFEDGYDAKGSTVNRTFNSPGLYKGKVLIEEKTNNLTRGKLETFEFGINQSPVARINKNIVGIPNVPVELDASFSFDNDGTIVKYNWTFGDSTFGEGKKVLHNYSTYGKYNVTLSVQDNSTGLCNTGMDSTVVIINAPPIAVCKEQINAAPLEPIKFDASQSNDPDGNIIKYIWDFSSYGIIEGEIAELAIQNPGIYNFKLTVQDNSSASNNKTTIPIKVIINHTPTAVAGANKIGFTNMPLVFDASKCRDEDGAIEKYIWNFGDGTTGEGINVTHTYQKVGKYNVTLQVQDNSGMQNNIGKDSLIVGINSPPLKKYNGILYSSNAVINFDGSRQFVPDNIISLYEWQFGDGTSGAGDKITHIYKASGTYNVILKITDKANGESSAKFDTTIVKINKRPIADPGPDRIITPGQQLTFTSANSIDPDGNIVKTNWYLQNQLVSGGNTFTYQFNNAGTYLVGLEVTDDFIYPLTDIRFAKIKVNSPPKIIADCTPLSVPNQKIKFDASKCFDTDGKITDFVWNFSDGEIKKGIVVEKAFKTPGVYTVKLEVKDDAALSNSITQETFVIKINSSPVIKTKELIETCDNVITFDASSSFDPDGDAISYTWTLPNNQSVNGSSVFTHNFEERGTVPVTITVNDGNNLLNSITKKTILVKLHQPPIADAGADTTVCAEEIVILSALNSKAFSDKTLSYEWILSDSTRLYGSNVFTVFRKGGVYKVQLKVKDNSNLNCSQSWDTKIITVISSPLANAGADFSACANSPVKFDGSASTDVDGIVNSYYWDFGDGETGGGVNPVHLYNKPGTYKVILTVTGDLKGECDNSSTDYLMLTIVEAPQANFVCKDSTAVNSQVSFDASESITSSGKIINYEWNFGDSTKAVGKTVTHKFTKYGLYTVTLKITTDRNNLCNSSSVSKSIYVNAPPVAKADGDKYGAVNQLVYFNASNSFDLDGQISKFSWDFGDGNISEGINPIHVYKNSGKYKVVLTVFDETNTDNNFNKDSFEITINEEPKAILEVPDYVYVGQQIILDGSKSIDLEGKITSFEWFADQVSISKMPTHVLSFTEAGLKKITLTVTDNSNLINSQNSITKYINVFEYPKVSLPDSIAICTASPYSLTPTVKEQFKDNSIAYTWFDKSNKAIYEGKDITLEILEEGNYLYTLKVYDKKNIIASDSVLVIANNSPLLRTVKDTIVYIGGVNDEIMFDVREYLVNINQSVKVLWKLGDGNVLDKPVINYKYKKEGVYKVELEVDNEKGLKCSKTKTSFNVIVKKL